MYCQNCGKPVGPDDVCPYCGWSNEKKPKKRRGCLTSVLAVIGAFFVFCIILAALGGSDTENPSGDDVNDDSEIQSTQPEASEADSLDSEEPTVDESQSVPQEYKNALAKAEVYSDTMYMSKLGIYKQLVSEYGENFPAEAAQYAIDNLEADYKENALKKARVYYLDMSMSKEAVYDQLVSEYGEQFTAEEAQYAIDNLE